MSYTTLTQQYKENLRGKILRYIKDELKGNAIEFDTQFFVDIIEEHDGETRWVCKGITEEGLVFGNFDWGDSLGDEVEFDINGLDVETMSYMLDQLLEVNYKTLIYEN